MQKQRSRLVLVTGATGRQGGAVARALLANGFTVNALTRKPDCKAAKALAAAGAKVFAGSLDDLDSLDDPLFGAWGAFAVQNPREARVKAEERQGKSFARLARDAGVQHFVYASTGSADRDTGVPRSDGRGNVEEVIRGLRFPYYAILRPVFFMENLVDRRFLHGDRLVSALDPDAQVQVVSIGDLARYAAMVFAKPTAFNGAGIDLAGDSVTMPQAAAILSTALGRPIEYVRIPLEWVRQRSVDLAALLEWVGRVGYDADVAGNVARYGIATQTLPQWVDAWARQQEDPDVEADGEPEEALAAL